MQDRELAPVTGCFSNPALAAGTTTTYSIGKETNYAIDGKLYNKAAASNQSQPSTDLITGASFVQVGTSKACMFVYCLKSDGSVGVAQSNIVSLDGAADGANAKTLDTWVPIGYFVIRVGASGTAFTLGTNNTSGVSNNAYTWQGIVGPLANPVYF